jgi:hypothetical protein
MSPHEWFLLSSVVRLRNRPAAKGRQSPAMASPFGAQLMAETGFSSGSTLAEWLAVEYQPSSRSA